MARDDTPTSRRDANIKRARTKTAKDDRDGSTFISIPHPVQQSQGWRKAKPISRSLLIDLIAPIYRKTQMPPRVDGESMADRYNRKPVVRGLPNGGLMVLRDELAKVGWTSNGGIQNALRDLVACGLLVETRKGGKNRPSLYAATWMSLGVSPKDYDLDIDFDAWDRTHRGAYNRPDPVSAEDAAKKEVRAAAARKATAARSEQAAAKRNAACGPSHGRSTPQIEPSDGKQGSAIEPSDGPVKGATGTLCAPSDGISLEHCHLSAPVPGSAAPTHTAASRPAAADDNRQPAPAPTPAQAPAPVTTAADAAGNSSTPMKPGTRPRWVIPDGLANAA